MNAHIIVMSIMSCLIALVDSSTSKVIIMKCDEIDHDLIATNV